MSTVQGDDSETYGVSKISGRKVTLAAPRATGANALDGTSLRYVLTGRAASGVVRMEEAGDDNTLTGTDDDDSQKTHNDIYWGVNVPQFIRI